jgi:hypothetical protein
LGNGIFNCWLRVGEGNVGESFGSNTFTTVGWWKLDSSLVLFSNISELVSLAYLIISIL